MTKAGRTNRYARWNPRQPRPSRPPRRVSLSRLFRRSHPRPPWRHSHRPPTSSRRKARTPRLCSHCQPAHHPRPLRPGGPPRRSCRGRRKAPCRPRGRFFQLAVTPLPHTSDSVHHRIIIPSRNSSPTWRSPETRPQGQLTLTYHVQDPAGIALSGTELRYSQMMGSHQQHHLCDCARCVSHALLRLRDAACRTGPPRRPGIRFNRVPGVTVAVAAWRDMHALIQMVADQPDCALIACGCCLCSLHRNLLWAWLQVVAADGPASS